MFTIYFHFTVRQLIQAVLNSFEICSKNILRNQGETKLFSFGVKKQVLMAKKIMIHIFFVFHAN